MKRIIQNISFLLLILSLNACSDFLDQEPGPQVSIEEQLSSAEGIKMALTGAYSSLENLVGTENFAIYGDLQSGNLNFSPIPSGSNKGQIFIPNNIERVYNFADLADDSDFESFYDNAYDVINQANLIIENIPNLSDLSASEISQILSESYAIRGYTHYLLLKVYAQSPGSDLSNMGIIYKEFSLKDELDYPSRLDVNESYNMVISDMETAINGFTDEPALAGPQSSYFNKINTEALLAKIHLSANNFQKSVELAKEVIQNSGISLMSKEEYISEWEEFSNPVSEILLELTPRRDQDGSLGGSLQQFFGFNDTAIYGDYVASNDLLAIYDDEDIRGSDMFIEASLPTLDNGELVDQKYYFTKKFQGEPGNPIVRLSEMYLIIAEANFRLGQIEESLNYLNIIRSRAGLKPLAETSELEEQILLERRREFAFEGNYFFDLKRNGKNIFRLDCQATTCNLDYPSPYFVLPIPQKNININENLQQNEGY